jgi:hypothetical protein
LTCIIVDGRHASDTFHVLIASSGPPIIAPLDRDAGATHLLFFSFLLLDPASQRVLGLPDLTLSLESAVSATMSRLSHFLALTSLLVVCDASIRTSPHQEILSQELGLKQHRIKVPGQNPAYHCDSPAKDLFQIHYMNDDPNPPEP